MSEVHLRINSLYTSMPYRWADAKQIRDDILEEVARPVMIRSECPEQLNKLASISKDLRDTLVLIQECYILIERRYNLETARTVDVLANLEQSRAGI